MTLLLEIEVSNIQRTKAIRVESIIDPNATTSAVLPTNVAEKAGITSEGTRIKIKVGNEILSATRCSAVLRIKEKEFLGPVLVAAWADRLVVGRFALESIGLTVNPQTNELEDTELFMYSVTERSTPARGTITAPSLRALSC